MSTDRSGALAVGITNSQRFAVADPNPSDPDIDEGDPGLDDDDPSLPGATTTTIAAPATTDPATPATSTPDTVAPAATAPATTAPTTTTAPLTATDQLVANLTGLSVYLNHKTVSSDTSVVLPPQPASTSSSPDCPRRAGAPTTRPAPARTGRLRRRDHQDRRRLRRHHPGRFTLRRDRRPVPRRRPGHPGTERLQWRRFGRSARRCPCTTARRDQPGRGARAVPVPRMPDRCGVPPRNRQGRNGAMVGQDAARRNDGPGEIVTGRRDGSVPVHARHLAELRLRRQQRRRDGRRERRASTLGGRLDEDAVGSPAPTTGTFSTTPPRSLSPPTTTAARPSGSRIAPPSASHKACSTSSHSPTDACLPGMHVIVSATPTSSER